MSLRQAIADAIAARPARIIADVPYGKDPLQRFDVYLPKNPRNAPVIFMVHGGGWWQGDKANANVVDNKKAYWVDKLGYILVSVNYRLVPNVTPADQVQDIDDAYRMMRILLPSWNGDPSNITLMGHSAGAQLTTMLVVQKRTNAKRAVILDSAGYNVEEVMDHKHPDIYDNAFGTSRDFWKSQSPTLLVDSKTIPMFLVFRTKNEAGQLPESALQAKQFAAAAGKFGSDITLYPSELSHGPINGNLGLPSAYTEAVAFWMQNN